MFASAGLQKELKGLKKQTRVEKIIWIDEAKAADEADVRFEEARRFSGTPDLSRQPKINDLAHIIYTSGTTGHPKGALISYGNLFSNLEGIERIFKITKRDRFVVFLPMFHSFTLTAMVLLPIYMACSIILVKSVFPVLQRFETGFAQTRDRVFGRSRDLHRHEQSENPLVFQMVQPRPSICQRRRAFGGTNHP